MNDIHNVNVIGVQVTAACPHGRKALLTPTSAGYPSIICLNCNTTLITIDEAKVFINMLETPNAPST